MKQPSGLRYSLVLLQILLIPYYLQGQIEIYSTDYPTLPGTLFINEDDTVNSVAVSVGTPGENQIWHFEQDFAGVFTRQQLIALEETPFHNEFPDANVSMRYVGRLGNLIHSYYFDEIYGNIYAFQNISSTGLTLTGVGIDSAVFTFQAMSFKFDGFMQLQPASLIQNFPLVYGDSSRSASRFTVEVDTMILGMPMKLFAHIKDTVVSIVDGWGTLLMPDSSYECLRIKSYIYLDENIFLNGAPFKSKHSATINYTWIAKKYGVVARMMSHTNSSDPDLNDQFTFAKQVSRLHRFNPKFRLSSIDSSGAPGDTLQYPVYISDLADLNITSIDFEVHYNTDILSLLELKCGTLLGSWSDSCSYLPNKGSKLHFEGELPFSGNGVLCYLKFVVNPNVINNDTTAIHFENIYFREAGPMIESIAGRFTVKIPTQMVKDSDSSTSSQFVLLSNYPNPFNAGTDILYRLPDVSIVRLDIYNALGQHIRTLVSSRKHRGMHHIHWDGQTFAKDEAPSGVYFYTLNANSISAPDLRYTASKKMILLR